MARPYFVSPRRTTVASRTAKGEVCTSQRRRVYVSMREAHGAEATREVVWWNRTTCRALEYNQTKPNQVHGDIHVGHVGTYLVVLRLDARRRDDTRIAPLLAERTSGRKRFSHGCVLVWTNRRSRGFQSCCCSSCSHHPRQWACSCTLLAPVPVPALHRCIAPSHTATWQRVRALRRPPSDTTGTTSTR